MPTIDEALLERLANVRREPVFELPDEEQERAFSKIARLCAVRERCESELSQRLAKDGFDSEASRAALARAVSCGLVDDARFGAVLVRSRIAQGKGRAGIESELSRLGIDEWSIDGWPDGFFSGDPAAEEFARALDVLRRKPPRAKNVVAAAYRRLVSKGYGAQTASAAARRFAEEAGKVEGSGMDFSDNPTW